MDQFVLVINCGSSSIKFALVDPARGHQPVVGLAERLGRESASLTWSHDGQQTRSPMADADHAAAMTVIIKQLESHGYLDKRLIAVGHRVVHGGEAFTESTLITSAVLDAIEACVPLAPLHNPANILGIKTAQKLFPTLPQVAVFDTSFHQTMPPIAYLYAIPYELYETNGVRRYGFHGTSHRYVTRQAARQLERPLEELALISLHLGNGCSAAAVLNGRSIDTTMGLTPLEGLMMGTRSGDIDPSLPAYLVETLQQPLADVMNILNRQSGLIGISGRSNDMRTVLQAAAEGDARSQLAIDLFCYRVSRAVGALIISLGRLDALIFTGGIGEHAAPIRAQVLEHLQVLGFVLDQDANLIDGQVTNGIITTNGGPIALVVPTDEERLIAEDSADLVNGA